jgi:hypothetical protein
MLEIREIKGSEESETAKGERGDGRNHALEKPGCVEDCAVAAELWLGMGWEEGEVL